MALTRITKGVIKPNENYDTHNINSTGIVTAIGLDVNGNGDISGDLSVGGVLTYEDVTSIDSVGIITAQKDIHVGAGVSVVGIVTAATFKGDGDFVDIDVDGHTNLDNVSIAGVTTTTDSIHIKADNKFLLLGQSNDLSLAHTAGHSYIADTGTGGLYLTGSNVRIQNAIQNEDIAVFNQNDSVDLYYDNVKQFETSAKGIQVGTGVTIETNGQAEIAGITTFYKDVHIKSATNRLYVGADDRISLIADPSHSYLRINGGHFQIHNNNFGVRSYTGNGSIVLIYAPTNDGSGSGGVQLYHNNGSGINPKRFQTTTQGIEVLGHSELDNVSVAGVTTASGMLNANGDITITSPSPTINFTENNGDPDYRIFLNGGILNIDDVTNNVQKFSINTTRITLNGTTLVNDNTLYIGDKLVHWTDDNTMIRFPANDTFSVETAGSERLRIDSNGRLLVGLTSDPAESTIVAKGNSTSATSYSVLDMRRGQAATSSGDVLGYIRFSDTNIPSTNNNYALIFGACDGASSGQGDNPGRLVFSTTVDGGSGPTEKLRIDKDGILWVNYGNPQSSSLMILDKDGTGEAALRFYNAGSNKAKIALDSDEDLTFDVNGSERLRINSAGISTFYNSQLHIEGAGSGNTPLTINTDVASNNSVHPLVEAYSDNATYKTQIGLVREGSSGNLGWAFFTNAVGSPIERLRIRSSGELMTQAAGQLYTASSAGSLTLAGGNTNLGGKIVLSGGNSPSTGDIRFYAQMSQSSPAERLRITSTGQVNIAPNNFSQTAYKVQIETGSNRFISIKTAAHNDFSDEGSGIFFSRQSDGSKELSGIFAHTNTSLGMASRGNLTFHAGGSSGYAVSPERLRITSDGIIETGTAIGGSGYDSNMVFRIGRAGDCNLAIRNTANTTSHTGIDFGDSGDDRAGRIQYMHNGDYMSFHTNGAGTGTSNERLRITSDGQLNLGSRTAVGIANSTTTPDHFRISRSDSASAPLITMGSHEYAQSTSAPGAVISSNHRDFIITKFHPNFTGNSPGFWLKGNEILMHSGGSETLRISSNSKVGINETSPENELHIAGTTGTNAGGLLRLDATTGDNFIIFDNTADSSEWVIGNDSGTRDQFRMHYNGGSGYGDPIIDIDGTTNNGVVTIDGGTTTLVKIKGDSAGTAGLRLGGDASQNQCTGYVEVHQDETHGGGMFYNGDGSPSFATGEGADYFSLFRASGGSRHSVMRWFHNSNDCNVQGNMYIDNGATSILRLTGDNTGTAGVSVGGDSGQTQSTGYLEVHQDRIHGGGISYNGDASPAFATGETADHITFYRMNNSARSEVFSYPYSSDTVTFNGEIVWGNSHANHNSYNFMGGYFQAGTSGQNNNNAASLANVLHYGYGYQEGYSTSNGGWSNPYPDLVLGYHTGVSLGGHPNYNGCRFFADHPSASSAVILNVGNGNNGVGVPHSLSKGGGSFRIRHPHPSKKYTHDLQHSFIEGPQCDNIYRGRVDLVGGSATINIDTVSNMTDGTFVLLNRDIQCFTSNETGWTAVKGSVSGNILTITAQDNSSTDTISWMVIGERQDDKIKSIDMDITDADGKLIVEPLTIELSHM